MIEKNYYPKGNDDSIESEKLLLDPANLRLMEIASEQLQNIQTDLIGQDATQEKIFKLIFDNFDIDGLRKSIISMGFLKHERLIVARYDSTKYIVLEGNRRLTAVKSIKNDKNLKLNPAVSGSIETLPCFVLEGDAISGKSEILDSYRKAADYYIGLRHLMSIKSWEPASRYEFQARLIELDGWTPEEVADKFGRKKNEVIRDLKAQILFRKFRDFEKQIGINHQLTYNAFSEGARAPAITNWLGWSSQDNKFLQEERLSVFFHYLIFRLKNAPLANSDQDDEINFTESAQKIVRQLRDILKINDQEIVSAIEERDFEHALLLFEDRKDGKFAQRVKSFTNSIRRVPMSDLEENPEENIAVLESLIKQIQRTISALTGIIKG